MFTAGNRCFSKDYASSDDEKSPKQDKSKEKTSPENSSNEESASSKLNRLLASMQTADDKLNFSKLGDIVPKPGEANRKRKLSQKQAEDSKDILAAARNVAAMLGDKPQQTESELLLRLLGGKPNASGVKEGGLPKREDDISLTDLIVGMKIDRRPQQKVPAYTRSEYVRRSLAARGNNKQMYEEAPKDKRQSQRYREQKPYTSSVKLFGEEPLGIFKDPAALKDSIDLLPTWSYLHEQALKVQVSHPPSNYFDKIARWTEQGKVWRFPIDNEQDWLDEKDVDFSEHIFLEQHLEGWCPNRGPIRHFMELVCVGLSKNPYITAKEKKDHIIWYKDYFASKKDLLKELITDNLKNEKNVAGKQQKQVEAS